MDMAHWFGRATRVAVFVAAWSGVATILSAQTREAPARVSPQGIAISLHDDGQRATVRARGASVRAVLAGLAEHARFTLLNLDRVPETTIDVEFVDAPVARIAESLLRDAGVGYLALSGPTELTLKTLVVAAGTTGSVTPEEAIAGISQVPLGAGNARTMTGTISGPVAMTGPPPGTPPQGGVTVPNPAAASPIIK